MSLFSFVHTGDIHLDCEFKGISTIDERVGNYLKNATFSSFNNIIQFCIDKKVDFIIISGDLYDSEDQSLRAQLKFLSCMQLLDKHHIQAYIARGNHDSLKGWSANLDFPSNTHFFGGKQVESFTFVKDDIILAKIFGISFLKRDTQENLSICYPKIKNNEDFFSIGVLHCNVGNNKEHESYSPCSVADLKSHGFDYWALGHIHAQTIVNKDPMIVYPGNPQGLNPKETGAKGFMYVSVDKDKRIEPVFFPSDSIRWFINEVSIQSISTLQALKKKLSEVINKNRQEADYRPSICRIILQDRGVIAEYLQRDGYVADLLEDIRIMESDETNFVWVENIYNKTKLEMNKEAIKQQKSFIGDLISMFEKYTSDPALKSQLIQELDALFQSPGGKKYLTPINPDSEEYIELLNQAENYCLNQLQLNPAEPNEELSLI